MASAASRQAAKQRALESVLNLFGDAKKGKAGGKGGGDGSQNMSAMIASLKRAEPIPGLEGLLEDPPAQKVATEKVYESRSLMLFRPADWPRRPAIFMVESKAFDQLILLTILTNCVTMAWESPLDPNVGPKAMFINVSRYTIAALRPADVFPLRAPRAPNFYSLLLLLARTAPLALSHLSPPSSPSLSDYGGGLPRDIHLRAHVESPRVRLPLHRRVRLLTRPVVPIGFRRRQLSVSAAAAQQ